MLDPREGAERCHSKYEGQRTVIYRSISSEWAALITHTEEIALEEIFREENFRNLVIKAVLTVEMNLTTKR